MIRAWARFRALSVARAVHTSARTGKVTVYYSKPELAWWDIPSRLIIWNHIRKHLKGT